MTHAIDKTMFLTLLEGLATTPGPSLAETLRRGVLEEYLTWHGVDCQADEAGNLWVRHGQGDWADAVVFDAHMDVVQEGYTETVEHRDGCLKGLGLADNLTAVTMLAMLAVDLKEQRRAFDRPLFFLFSTGEEGEGDLCGVRRAVQDHAQAPYAFVSFDLSFDEYSVAGLGSLRYALTLSCPGGHSWNDDGLPGAIDQVMMLLTELKEKVAHLSGQTPGRVSFNIGSIEGGEGINSIARSAQARFEFRSVDPDVLESLDQVVEESLVRLNRTPGVRAAVTLIGSRPAARPVCPERIEPSVLRILRQAGETPRPAIRSTNINATLSAGWPSICLGLCDGGRFHSPDEYVVIDSLDKGWTVLGQLAGALLTKG